MKRPKRILLVALSIWALLVTAAPIAHASQPRQHVTLTYWTQDANPTIPKEIADFERANPGITIKLTVYGTNAYLQAVKVAASSNTLPDVLYEGLGRTLANFYESNGLVLDLTKYAQRDGWYNQFLPLAFKVNDYQGRVYGIPTEVLGMGVFYRKDIFARYHIAVPTTFNQFTTALATLKAHGVVGLSMGGVGSWLTMRLTDALLEHYAGPTLNDKLANRQAPWNSPAVVQTFTTLKAWADKGYLTPGFMSINPQDDQIPWMQGKAAMVFEGPWVDAGLITAHQDLSKYGFFPFPEDRTPERLSVFAQQIMVSARTAHAPEAVKFIEYLDSKANLTKYAGVLNGPFARIGVENPGQPHTAQIKGLLLNAKSFYMPTDQDLPESLVQQFFHAQDSVVAGTMTPAQAASFIQQQIATYHQ